VSSPDALLYTRVQLINLTMQALLKKSKTLAEVIRMIKEIPIQDISANPWQPRLNPDDDDVQSLANSIESGGLLHPVVVRTKDDRYEIVAGHRRLKAFRLLGYEQIPAIIKEVSDQQMLELSLVENLQRRTITPVEEAKAFTRLQRDFNLTQSEIAIKLGLTRDYVGQRMRLLSFPEELQEFVSHDTISVSVAEAMVSAPQELMQKMISSISTGYRPTVIQIKAEVEAYAKSVLEHRAAQSKSALVDEILGTVLRHFKGVNQEKILFYCPKCVSAVLEIAEVDGHTRKVCPKCQHAIELW